MLQILGLHGRCRRYMLSRLTLHNCLDLYNFAKSLGNAELQKGTFDL
uniref:Uncharacterized protein n=1 Tax=Ciona savignyi TaxID=51511 RepID=H2YHF0_CIOSA